MELKRVIRLDSLPMSKAYFTPEGFLRDKPILTSTGIFEYSNPDGSIRRELRLPEDVFSPESLKSYRGKPVVVTHDAGLIDKNNVAENQIGTILSEGERSGDDVRAEIIIHDTDAMKDAGFKELSLGYNLDLDETPGEWHGQHYDAIQRNIRINHLALVRDARAGEQARLNLDSRDNKNVLKGGKKMSKKIVNARRGDAVLSDEEFAKAIDEYKARKAEREKTDADDVEEVEAEETKKPMSIEEQVEEVKARRDRRDEAGDPKDTDEAMSVIAHQDEDLDILFDIIDTLLAKQDFDAADEEEEETVEEEEKMDELDKLNKLKGDADDEEESIDEEEEEVAEDADDEELPEDEEIVEEEEEVAEDADDEELPEDEEVAEEEEEFDEDDCGKEKRMDSAASRAIRNHMMMGKLGRQVGLKNLEFKDLKSAKIAIVKAVRPDMRLDGKSDAYINGAFDNAKKSIRARKAKGVSYQKRQMFNQDSRSSGIAKDSAAGARQRMIERLNKNK